MFNLQNVYPQFFNKKITINTNIKNNILIFLNLLSCIEDVFNVEFNLDNFRCIEDFNKNIVDLSNTISVNYNIFKNLNLSSNIDILMNNNTFNNIKNCINNNNNTNIIDYVYKTNMNKETYKYYNNTLLSDYIACQANVNINDNIIERILDGNVKINSFTNSIINKLNKTHNIDWSKNKQNIYLNTFNENDIYNLEFLLTTKEKFNIIDNNILFNDLKDSNNSSLLFDLILFDLPSDIHNIIHANCCDKVKTLKIRGTKSESLLLQFVMCSLNKNGRAFVIVPDSFLLNQSIQPVNTKNYLMDNFNVIKIVHLDEEITYNKGVKYSIIYFKNNGKTNNVKFNKLILKNNLLVEEEIITVNYDKITNCNFQLYYKIYLDNIENNTQIEYKPILELYNFIDISPSLDIKKLNTDSVIVFDKYYKDNNSINIVDVSELKFDDNNYFLMQEIPNNSFVPGFLNNYIKYIINTKINLFTKGKMNQLCIDKINKMKIPNLSINVQNSIINYYNYSNNLYKSNLKDIEKYQMLKNNLFEVINTDTCEELSNIIKLYSSVDLVLNNNLIIGIIKNAKNAGTSYIVNDKNDISTNSHYIEVINSNFIDKYVYYYLSYNKDRLNELSNINQQSNLTKTNLLSFNIPIIDLDIQQVIINYCDDFTNNINKLLQDNENIKNKDIMSIIFKLNNL